MSGGTEDMSPAHGRVLSSGIYQLLLQRRMLDVTITCAGEAIMAHKAVLVSYSKFLDTVFAGQGDDCDVLNMDNLGLEFEAIRAVIFFMYKGVVDMERCGEEAFQQAAKVLCVDTVPSEPEPTPAPAPAPAPVRAQVPAPVRAPSPVPIQPQPPRPVAVLLAGPGSSSGRTMVDEAVMTDQPRITSLSRDTQTDWRLTGLPEFGDCKKTRIAYVQTEITAAGSKKIPEGLKDLGTKPESILKIVPGKAIHMPENPKQGKPSVPGKSMVLMPATQGMVFKQVKKPGDKTPAQVKPNPQAGVKRVGTPGSKMMTPQQRIKIVDTRSQMPQQKPQQKPQVVQKDSPMVSQKALDARNLTLNELRVLPQSSVLSVMTKKNTKPEVAMVEKTVQTRNKSSLESEIKTKAEPESVAEEEEPRKARGRPKKITSEVVLKKPEAPKKVEMQTETPKPVAKPKLVSSGAETDPGDDGPGTPVRASGRKRKLTSKLMENQEIEKDAEAVRAPATPKGTPKETPKRPAPEPKPDETPKGTPKKKKVPTATLR